MTTAVQELIEDGSEGAITASSRSAAAPPPPADSHVFVLTDDLLARVFAGCLRDASAPPPPAPPPPPHAALAGVLRSCSLFSYCANSMLEAAARLADQRSERWLR